MPIINGYDVKAYTLKQADRAGLWHSDGSIHEQHKHDLKLRPENITYYLYVDGAYKGISTTKDIGKIIKDGKLDFIL